MSAGRYAAQVDNSGAAVTCHHYGDVAGTGGEGVVPPREDLWDAAKDEGVGEKDEQKATQQGSHAKNVDHGGNHLAISRSQPEEGGSRGRRNGRAGGTGQG